MQHSDSVRHMVRQRSDSANSSDRSDSQGPRAQVVNVVSSDEVAWARGGLPSARGGGERGAGALLS